ncbi:MAG: ATP-dependent Clp protease proteolytic subunit [Actinomycetota bacterium]
MLIPMVIEQSGVHERSFDIYSRLLRDRIVFCGSALDDQVANLLTAQMLDLEHEDSEAPISLYINSPGGSVDAMFAVYDVMQYVRSPVHTICMGFAASAAAVLLASGEPGKRSALPNSRILIHQPHGQIGHGQASDIAIHAEDMLRQRRQMEEMLARHTGQSIETIAKDTDRDNIKSPEEAKAYGLIDEIISPRKLDAFVPAVSTHANGHGRK